MANGMEKEAKSRTRRGYVRRKQEMKKMKRDVSGEKERQCFCEVECAVTPNRELGREPGGKVRKEGWEDGWRGWDPPTLALLSPPFPSPATHSPANDQLERAALKITPAPRLTDRVRGRKTGLPLDRTRFWTNFVAILAVASEQ